MVLRRSAIATIFLGGLRSIFAQSRPPIRQSFDLQVAWIPEPVRVGGNLQLTYELHVTNYSERALALNSVQIVDARSGAVILDLSAGALSSVSTNKGLAISPLAGAIVYLSAPLPASAVPPTLKHRIRFGAQTDTVEGGSFTVRAQSLMALGPPLRGGSWAAIYHPSWERGHRRVVYAVNGKAQIPGRFAIDWMKVDEQGKFASGDASKPANWYGYGAEVLAVRTAVVAAVKDDIPEPASVSNDGPLGKVTLENASGNYVSLDLGDGRFAIYEHLKPGSIRVKAGDRVQRGQVIAALGYTGQSTGPHLHFHVASNSSPLDAEGLPYALDSFDQLGVFASLEAFGKSQPWTKGASLRRGELPASLAVVQFPAQQ